MLVIEGSGTVLGPALATPLPDWLPLPLAPVLDGVSSATAGLVRFLTTDIQQPQQKPHDMTRKRCQVPVAEGSGGTRAEDEERGQRKTH